MKKNIAIVAPFNNAYSETFIQAHKNLLYGNIKFYYSGSPPMKMEGKGFLKSDVFSESYFRILRELNKNPDILYYKRFRHSLKAEKIDLVLVEYGTTAIKILNICKELKIPMIVHFHGADSCVYSVIEENRQNYKEVFGYASYIISVSKVMNQKLLDLGAPKEKLVLNTYGPNNIFQEVNPTYESNAFIGIGRFVDKKAPYYTVLAFSQILKTHPQARIKLAGDGPLLNSTKNLVRYLGIEKNVDFLGIITPEQYKNELENSIGFVQHSITADDGDMEGTPLAVLEASSAGLPVISTFHAGIQDVILHKKTGLLVEEHDVDGMAENIIKILDSKDLSKELGRQGKERIHNLFSLKRHITVIDELIETATKK